MKNKTKNAAIKHARETVGELFKFGDDNYKYLTFDESLNAWRESYGAAYRSALAHRSASLIEAAWEYLGIDKYVYYDGGSWIDYV